IRRDVSCRSSGNVGRHDLPCERLEQEATTNNGQHDPGVLGSAPLWMLWIVLECGASAPLWILIRGQGGGNHRTPKYAGLFWVLRLRFGSLFWSAEAAHSPETGRTSSRVFVVRPGGRTGSRAGRGQPQGQALATPRETEYSFGLLIRHSFVPDDRSG